MAAALRARGLMGEASVTAQRAKCCEKGKLRGVEASLGAQGQLPEWGDQG